MLLLPLLAGALFRPQLVPLGLACALAAWPLRLLARQRLSVRSPADLSLALLALLPGLSLRLSPFPGETQAAAALLLAGLAVCHTIVNWADTPRRLHTVAWCLVAGGAGLALLGLVGVRWAEVIKLPLVPAALYARYPLWLADPINPNVLAGSLALLAPLALAACLSGRWPAHPAPGGDRGQRGGVMVGQHPGLNAGALAEGLRASRAVQRPLSLQHGGGETPPLPPADARVGAGLPGPVLPLDGGGETPPLHPGAAPVGAGFPGPLLPFDNLSLLPGADLALLAGALATALIVGTLGLTQSRGAYVGAAVGLAVVAIARWPRRGLAGVALLTGAAAWLFYRAGPAAIATAVLGIPGVGGVAQREEIWSRAIAMLRDHPWTGVGMGAYGRAADLFYPFRGIAPGHPGMHAHDLLLQVGADLGLPGLVAYLALLGTALAGLIWLLRRGDRCCRWLAAGLLGGLAAIMVHGLVDAVVWGTKPAIFTWAVLGLAIALGAWGRRQGAPVRVNHGGIDDSDGHR